MNQFSNLLKSRWTAIALILSGVLVVVAVVKSGKGPAHQDSGEKAIDVSYIKVEYRDVEPRITGHGVVKPTTQYQAIAEVNGRLTYVSNDLKNGALLDKGTLVAEIDATDYKLALEQAEASSISAQTDIVELELREKSLKENHKLLKERLAIAEQELARKTKLSKRGSISQSALDAEKQNVISLRLEKVNLERDISMLPSTLAMAKAQLKSAEANIVLQQRNIDRTKFYMPFTGRVNNVVAEDGQFVATGKALFFADNIDKVEISTQIPLKRLREFLVWATESNQITSPVFSDIHDAEVNAQLIQDLIQTLGLNARVHLALSGNLYWSARVVSVGESVSMSTQTATILVEVDEPYKDIKPGVQPPLLKGMQVSVELAANPKPGVLIPRHALHDQGLYQIAEDRLKISALKPALMMDDWLLFSPEQLAENSLIITSDMASALPGRKVEGIHDQELQAALKTKAMLPRKSGGE
ncbi:hypothetical protein L3Q72_17870 [Vibrio sp. JC009]|uniref:efflux RND transporter periplasmic adaptor subunit n=1 Tax=Vibrio sp. JC009 TaxID=2912314 RepID=UPI0023AFB3BA|nr:hypothetical protein [Vibrio sp. JC009]WED24743.1 hypothetical protein L3Q72_17870 [Vibrio sp. JC009]